MTTTFNNAPAPEQKPGASIDSSLAERLGRVLNLKPLIEQIYRFVNSFCSSLHQPLISI